MPTAIHSGQEGPVERVGGREGGREGEDRRTVIIFWLIVGTFFRPWERLCRVGRGGGPEEGNNGPWKGQKKCKEAERNVLREGRVINVSIPINFC